MARGGKGGRSGQSTGRADNSAPDLDWVTRLADEVIAESNRRAPGRPVMVASGISPSGPIHLGNLREIMVPHLVADEIRRRGIDCEHLLSWDDYDRFRKVPAAIEGIEAWNTHIGRPLTAVPAPPGSAHASWAAHFRAAMEESLAALGVRYRGISQTQMYTRGAYREQILLAMRRRGDIDAVLARFRTKQDPSQTAAETSPAGPAAEQGAVETDLPGHVDTGLAEAAADEGGSGTEYYPYKPYCQVCQRDTATVTGYDEATTHLEYRCECGHVGELWLNRDNHGKLVWKVDWPMRWAYEGVIFEPSGVDHQSPGSSFEVGGYLVRDIFGGDQPIGPMYAFVGISGMAKMSSSKGGVPTPADALAIMEPPLLRWLYARRRPNQSFTVAFDAEIHRLYDEWDALVRKVDAGSAQPGDLAMYARSARTAEGALPATPRPLPYRALASVVDITAGNPEQMLRILTTMDEGSGRPPATELAEFDPRLACAATWVTTQLAADERTLVRAQPDHELLASLDASQREGLDLLCARLSDDWSLEGLTSLVYGVPKLQAGFELAEKTLPPEVKTAQRDFFALLYQLFVGSQTGPRLPTLLLCLGPERTRTLLGRG